MAEKHDDIDLSSDDEGGVQLLSSSAFSSKPATQAEVQNNLRHNVAVGDNDMGDIQAARRVILDGIDPVILRERRLEKRQAVSQQPKDGPLAFVEPTTPSGKAYFQDTLNLAMPGMDLWQLPVQVPRRPDRKIFALIDDSMQTYVYHKSCTLIRDNWRCEAADALPDMLREATPYSLALLLQLRMLASHTKKNRSYAQTLLTTQWQMRLGALGKTPGPGAREFQTTHITSGANLQNLQHCEPMIQENVVGLTLEDISSALSIARMNKQRSKKNDAAYQAKRAAKIADRRERKELARQTAEREKEARSVENDAPALSQALWKEAQRLKGYERQKKAKEGKESSGHMRLDEVRMQRMVEQSRGVSGNTAHPDVVSAYQPVSGDIEQTLDLDSMSYGKLSKQDSKKFNQIAHAMDRHFQFTEKKKSRRPSKRDRMLRALTQSGGRDQGNQATLPSEKYDFSTMPTLHARVGDVKEQEMANAMRAMELVQMGQKPLPWGPETTSYDVSADDNKWFRR